MASSDRVQKPVGVSALVILAAVAVLADLTTYLIMGGEHEVNQMVQHFSPPMAVIAKLALIVAVVSPVLVLMRERRYWSVTVFVPGLAFVLCSIGAISNVLVI